METPTPWWRSWSGVPRWAEAGRSWTCGTPDGMFFVEVRRRGVEPTGALGVGLVDWLVTRLRWQLSRRRTWEVEVLAPWSRGRWTRRSRRVWTKEFRTLDEAVEGGTRMLSRLQDDGVAGLTD